MNPELWWYISRAAGIVAWAMLTASVLWGIVLASDLFPRCRRPAWLLSMHRWLAGLTLVFLAGHLSALLLDKTVRFAAADLLIPYASSWRPTAVAVGIVAFYLLVAVEATALAEKRLPANWWRSIHLVSYWVFWAVSVHAALAGTDTSTPMYLVASLLALGLTVFGASYRALTHHLPRRRARGGEARAAGPAPVRAPLLAAPSPSAPPAAPRRPGP